jgi:type I restriction enzyme R subunit
VNTHEYLDRLRELVDSRRYEEALAFAEREDEQLEQQLSLKELGTLSVLMEHANLGAAVRGGSPSPSTSKPRGAASASPDAQGLESERRTRRRRIDPRLEAQGWRVVPYDPAVAVGAYTRHAVTEYPTASGPADYALIVDGRLLGIVEAKKLSLGAQGVLTQAERYARGVAGGSFRYERGLRVPFLYATNGEVIWFHDVRHARSRSHQVAQFHTPAALAERLGHDLDTACARLAARPNSHEKLRPYQREANAAVERAIAERKRRMLIAMATGTGKTFTLVNQVYRLMKEGAARRVLFLVDRRALAAQAVRAFASFEPETGLKFDQVYEVYSQALQRDDTGDDRFDPKILPSSYLTDPQRSHTFVYVCTVQRMAINLFGRDVVLGDDALDEDAARVANIPIHAFDLVIADECHRGYTAQEASVWRNTLNHFDATTIGLTATPAAHTTTFFGEPVFRYEYRRAVDEGFLVDYDAVNVKSNVRLHGVFLKEGEEVGVVNPGTGGVQLDFLEDERHFDTTEVEQKVTAPASNRRILEEIKRYADEHEARYGRFPKTLVFAVNDLPHTSHADQLVDLARDVFGRGDGFVRKITGRADRPLQEIREFRNRREPGVVVTVDLLTTGVDVPDLEFIVLLRPVKSRILFEQMLGRGTRLSENYPDKSHFTVFDCFDGTLLAYFKQTTGLTAEPPDQPSRTIRQIVEEIWRNQDRDYNARCLAKRLQRVEREMSGEARDLFAAYVPDGDLARLAAALPRLVREDFTSTMKLLRDEGFQDLLVNYPRPARSFVIAYGADDEVTSERLLRESGVEYKPEDYLDAFGRFVRERADEIVAIRILLDRPREWSTAALEELRRTLRQAPERFTPERLEVAHRVAYRKALVDIISMVKHAADEAQPLLTADERVHLAFARLTAGRSFSAEQEQWLGRIREHLLANLSIGRDDFESMPVFARFGGWGRANRVFDGRLEGLIHDLNEAIAA